MINVRPYRAADSPALASLHRQARGLPQLIGAGGNAWVVDTGQTLVGYISLAPVPGLPGIVNLDGFVVKSRRRKGLGTALLQHAVRAVSGTGITQLSHAVSSLESGTAHFLRANNFYLEHEEWRLEKGDLEQLPPLSLPEEVALQTFARREAIAHFLTLYERSFGDTPWYQPYTAGEVSAELDGATDLLFLVCEGGPVGFAWTRLERGATGMIEPFGIASAFQGRGHGRSLLRAALHQLMRRGAQRAQLDLWRSNQAALALYRDAGFRQSGTRYYLALDL